MPAPGHASLGRVKQHFLQIQYAEGNDNNNKIKQQQSVRTFCKEYTGQNPLKEVIYITDTI